MNTNNSRILAIAACLFITFSFSCAPKRMTVHPAAEVEREDATPVVVEKATPEPVKQEPVVTPVVAEKPNYAFSDIQFEYDSHVLKTNSYQVLDRIAREMLKDESAKFIIDGHASIEGTPEYNMTLSVDRANAVKVYLVNSGVRAANLQTKGYGATRPTSSNETESGRARNRRVEIRHTP